MLAAYLQPEDLFVEAGPVPGVQLIGCKACQSQLAIRLGVEMDEFVRRLNAFVRAHDPCPVARRAPGEIPLPLGATHERDASAD